MRSYRFKQLSVQVPLSGDQVQTADIPRFCGPITIPFTCLCASNWGPSHCTWYTPPVTCAWGTITVTCAGTITPTCGGSITDPTIIYTNPVDIEGVKQQLRQQLAALEAAPAAGTPQTLEEATQLEQQMTSALEELRARKAQLQQGGAPGGAYGAPGTGTPSGGQG